jgi:maltose phosphorylase
MHKKLVLIMVLRFTPMVATMNGEECHNEWEITLKKFRNGAIALAYTITIDTVTTAISLKSFEVLIAIARFWHQRATFLTKENQYVILE